MQQQPMTLKLSQTLPLESPFAWRKESFYSTRRIEIFPSGMDPTISFTATRNSKILGYIPLLGTMIGVSRVYKGLQEYKFFNNIHLHSFSNRSVKWIVRGVLEAIPVLGGITCIIADIMATALTKPHLPQEFEDETPCGYCHQCKC